MIKPRENRVPIMMSDEELSGVDDWRYSNRVATRSEAIRRLCQIGMRALFHIDPIMKASSQAVDHAARVGEAWGKKLEEHEGAKDLEMYAREIAVLFSMEFPQLEDELVTAHNRTVDMTAEFHRMLNFKSVEEAIVSADLERSEAQVRRQEWALEQQMAELEHQKPKEDPQ